MSWSIVGAVTAESSNGTLTFSGLPTTASGDVFVVGIASRGTGSSVTVPADWAAAAPALNEGDFTSAPSGTMLWVQRGGSLPALSFTYSGGDAAVGGLVIYRSSVSGTVTKVAQGSDMNGSVGSNVTVASLTSTAAGALFVSVCVAGDNGLTFQQFDADDAAMTTSSGTTAVNTTTAPTAGQWRERVDTVTALGSDAGVGIADCVRATAGASGLLSGNASIATTRLGLLCAVFQEPTGSGSVSVSPSSAAMAAAVGSVSASGNLAGTSATATPLAVPAMRARVGVVQGPGRRVRHLKPSGGSNANTGADSAPWATFQGAHDNAVAGDVIYVWGDSSSPYEISTRITVSKDGTASAPICVLAYPGETPLIEGTPLTGGYTNGIGVVFSAAAYWRWRGIEIQNCPEFGIRIYNNSHDIDLDLMEVHEIGIGSTIGAGAGVGILTEDTCYNIRLWRTDSYNCELLSDADCFQNVSSGSGNEIRECRGWRSTDDVLDLFAVTAGMTHGAMIIDQCWFMEGGYKRDGTASTGDGNGAKLGGQREDTSGNPTSFSGGHTVTRCIAVGNRVNGFDENGSSIVIKGFNNTAAHNGRGFYCSGSGNGNSANHQWKNNLSYRNPTSTSANAATGTTAASTNNSWQSGVVTLTDADFANSGSATLATVLAEMKAARGHDGSLPTLTVLQLASGSDLRNAGTTAVTGVAYTESAPDLGALEFEGTSATVTASVPGMLAIVGAVTAGGNVAATPATVNIDGTTLGLTASVGTVTTDVTGNRSVEVSTPAMVAEVGTVATPIGPANASVVGLAVEAQVGQVVAIGTTGTANPPTGGGGGTGTASEAAAKKFEQHQKRLRQQHKERQDRKRKADADLEQAIRDVVDPPPAPEQSAQTALSAQAPARPAFVPPEPTPEMIWGTPDQTAEVKPFDIEADDEAVLTFLMGF